MRTRAFVVLVAAMLLAVPCVPTLAAPVAPETALATATTFLSDPALPTFANRANAFSRRPDRQNPFFRLPLETQGGGVISYMDIAAVGDKVIDYVAGLPEGAMPATIRSLDECQGIATEFAKRQLPALFEAGAEVKCDPEPKLGPNAAYLFKLCRTQQGIPVPPRAVVGVRVTDGKVVRWTPEYQTLSIPLEPKLTLDQAVEALKPYLANFGWLPNTMLESWLEVVVFKGAQRLAWGIKMEMHSASSNKDDAFEGLCFCHVDANDGKLLDRDFPPINRETYAWYVSKGGKHVPTMQLGVPPVLFVDAYPSPSPDGKRILFVSTRPRAGCPEWMPNRPAGVFVVNADGTDMACVLPTGAGHPQWGPKDQIAFIKDGLAVLDLATGGRVSFPTDHDHEYTDFVWLKDGRIVAIYGFQSFTSQLVILDPKKPTAPPMELGAPTIGPERHQALALDVKGKLLYTVKTPLDPNPGADERRNKEPYRLCRLDLTQRPPREEVLVPYLAGGARIFVGGDGKAYLGCPTTGSYQVADLSSNQVANWQPPQIACPDSTFRAAVFPVPADFVALPGGGLVFSADYYSGKPQDERAQVIYTCGADGRASRLITHPEKRLIDTYVFPVSRKAAF